MKITKFRLFLLLVLVFLVSQVLLPPIKNVSIGKETGVAGKSFSVGFKAETFLPFLVKMEVVEMDNPYRGESSYDKGDGSKRPANGINGPKVRVADLGSKEAVVEIHEDIPKTKFYQIRAKYPWNIFYNYNRQDLRVAVLDREENLPPDPGEKGKEALLGVDTDSNGLRDDLDREITFDTPFSWKAREAHKRAEIAYYKTWDPNLTKAEKEKLAHIETLLLSCMSKNIQDWYNRNTYYVTTGISNWTALSINTKAREQMFRLSMYQGGPRTMEEYENPCPADLAP